MLRPHSKGPSILAKKNSINLAELYFDTLLTKYFRDAFSEYSVTGFYPFYQTSVSQLSNNDVSTFTCYCALHGRGKKSWTLFECNRYCPSIATELYNMNSNPFIRLWAATISF